MYPLLPTMHGTNYQVVQQALDELIELYREDDVTLSQKLIWMGIFLERTDTIAKPEKDKIQEKLNMYDQLWEEHSKIKRIRAESKAEGIAEGIVEGEARGEEKGKVKALQNVLVTTVELRFPALAELAEKQVKQINKSDLLSMLFRQITTASDENIVRHVLNSLAA